MSISSQKAGEKEKNKTQNHLTREQIQLFYSKSKDSEKSWLEK